MPPDTASPPSFDLTHDQWLLTRFDDGVRKVSLRDAFTEADGIRSIVGELPTQSFALLRLLLAILHASLRPMLVSRKLSPLELWKRLWDSADPLSVLTDPYLDRWQHRFDLLHPIEPFYQVADLRTEKGETTGLERIIADVPNGEPYFTTRRGRGVERISLAEGARWLVHAQAFDPSGIKSGALGDERVKGGKGYPIGTGWAGSLGGVLVEGESLRETLLLNLVLGDVSTGGPVGFPLDAPIWERDAVPGSAIRTGSDGEPWEVAGPLDLLTWQSRRIRLFAGDEGVTAVLLANGDALEPQNRHGIEHMTSWRRSQAQEKKRGESLVYMPRTHDPERSVWRGLAALLPQTSRNKLIAEGSATLTPGVLDWIAVLTSEGILESDAMLRTRAIGLEYGSQNSTVTALIDDAVTIHSTLLSKQGMDLAVTSLDAVEQTDKAVTALASLGGNLAVAAGDKQEGARERARELGYFALDAPFRQWLNQLGSESTSASEAKSTWYLQAYRILRELGDQAVEDSGPSAWIGREKDGRNINASEAHGWFLRALSTALPKPPKLAAVATASDPSREGSTR